MKNYIKDFSQFQRINEQDSSQGPSWEELVDEIADRMYENGMNGTLSSNGNVEGAHGRTLDDNTAEIVVEWKGETFKFTLHKDKLNDGGMRIEVSLRGKNETSSTTKDDYEEPSSYYMEVAGVMSDMLIEIMGEDEFRPED